MALCPQANLKEQMQHIRRAAQLQADGELTAVPLVSGKCDTLLQLLAGLFAAHQDDAEYKGIIFVQQECKALSLSLAL